MIESPASLGRVLSVRIARMPLTVVTVRQQGYEMRLRCGAAPCGLVWRDLVVIIERVK